MGPKQLDLDHPCPVRFCKAVKLHTRYDARSMVELDADLPLEIERKFLATTLPDLQPLPRSHIRQGYLGLEEGYGVRVRQKGSKYFRTAKRGLGKARVEIETEITEQEFNHDWPKTEGRRIEKTRYEMTYGTHVIEIDVFEGVLAGKVLVEVEFPSLEECDAYIPQPWFGREVTEDPPYSNFNLARDGWPEDLP
jgi:CYTH domain-containing protein